MVRRMSDRQRRPDDALRSADDAEADARLVWLMAAEAEAAFRLQGRDLSDWDFSGALALMR